MPGSVADPAASMQMQGGGNCGNALTAVARMGVRAALVSKIGSDGISEQILAEFEREGVDTQQVLRAKGPSPFTYIIVDRAGALGYWWSTLSWSRFLVEGQWLLSALLGAWQIVFCAVHPHFLVEHAGCLWCTVL